MTDKKKATTDKEKLAYLRGQMEEIYKVTTMSNEDAREFIHKFLGGEEICSDSVYPSIVGWVAGTAGCALNHLKIKEDMES